MLYRFNDRGKPNNEVVMLESITKEEEQYIDDNNQWIRTKGGKDIIINKRNILFYGEINVNDENDVNLICKKKLVDDNLLHSWVPSNFNYALGIGAVKYGAPTNNPILWFKYCHVRIGKPKRVIAYRIKETLAT